MSCNKTPRGSPTCQTRTPVQPRKRNLIWIFLSLSCLQFWRIAQQGQQKINHVVSPTRPSLPYCWYMVGPCRHLEASNCTSISFLLPHVVFCFLLPSIHSYYTIAGKKKKGLGTRLNIHYFLSILVHSLE